MPPFLEETITPYFFKTLSTLYFPLLAKLESLIENHFLTARMTTPERRGAAWVFAFAEEVLRSM